MAKAATTTAVPSRPEHELGRARQTGWALLGRVAYGACQLGLLVAITRLGGRADIGDFSLALAVTAPPMVFANLQLRALYATDVDARFSWRSYAIVRVVATAFALVACVALAAAHHGQARWAIAWLAVAKAAETLSDLQHGVFQRRGRMECFGQSMTLRGVGSIAAVAITLAVGAGLSWAMAAMALTWIAALALYDWPRARALRVPGTRGDATVRLLLQGLPLGTVFLLDSLHQNLPRYFVEATLGTASLGLFAPMAYMVTIGSAFAFAIAAPQAPRLAELARRGQARELLARTRRMSLRTGALGLVGVALAWSLGAPVLGVVFGPAWAAEADTLVLVAIAGTLHFAMVPVMLALTAARALAIQLTCYLAAIVGCALACAAWLPTGGIAAAASASAIGMACGLVTATLALRRRAAAMEATA